MTKLICIEGLDGSGKTTIMKKLKERYEEHGIKALFTSPFLTTDYDVQFKMDLLNSKDHLIELTGMSNVLLRFQNYLKKMVEKKEYDVIVMDRYIPSFFTYQVYTQHHQTMISSYLLYKLMMNFRSEISYYLIVANEENTKSRLCDNVVDDGDIRTLTNYNELLEGYKTFFNKGGENYHILSNDTYCDLENNISIIHGVNNA